MPQENIRLLPDPARTMEGLRDMGYSFETAVADVVDNSIAANASVVDIAVRLDFRGNVRVSIADNGDGMDKERLIEGMTYGSPERPNPASLGKYGLGLKTASTAWCRRLSVISRHTGQASPIMATWDLDYVAEESAWLLQVSDEPDLEAVGHLDRIASGASGTVVIWSKVDQLLRSYKSPSGAHAKRALEKHCENLRVHLAMTYQRFLDSGDKRARDVRIVLDDQRVRPWDPFQAGTSELVAQESQPVAMGARQTVFTVRAFILPRQEEFPNDDLAQEARVSPKYQGIFIYREQRLIHWGDWLGMFSKEPHLNLLRVEFSFDHRLDDALHLDVRKSQIILDDDLLKWLRDFVGPPRREANSRYRKGRSKTISDEAKKGSHDASNQTIANKDSLIGGPKITITNPVSGDVTVTNQQGTFPMRLPVSSALSPGQVHVEPADEILDGLLFEPALIDTRKAVRINTGHPYYHKVYVPNFSDSVTVQGLDSLLWALCVAELSATSDSTGELFNDVRREVSRVLRRLVEGLPDPADSDISDASDG